MAVTITQEKEVKDSMIEELKAIVAANKETMNS